MFDRLFPARRREALRQAGLSAAQWAQLDAHSPRIAALGEKERTRLGELVSIFLDEKQFEGGAGFQVTEAMRLLIAGEACLLLVRREDEVPYPKLLTVIVYEDAWRNPREERHGGGVVSAARGVILGESWGEDTVILSWAQVRRGAAIEDDGHNVTLHEFAHQLDAQDGAVDGAPQLPSRARYAQWARVLRAEFEALREGQAETPIDDYGATSPPEFFAVVTELFYERPADLAAHNRELYTEMCRFYGFDPLEVGSSDEGSAPSSV